MLANCTGKDNGFPFLDILGYLMNTHKNPKFGKVRQVPTRKFPTKFPDWDLSHSSKFGIFVGKHQKWESVIYSCVVYFILLPYNMSIILKLKGHVKEQFNLKNLNFFKEVLANLLK